MIVRAVIVINRYLCVLRGRAGVNRHQSLPKNISDIWMKNDLSPPSQNQSGTFKIIVKVNSKEKEIAIPYTAYYIIITTSKFDMHSAMANGTISQWMTAMFYLIFSSCYF